MRRWSGPCFPAGLIKGKKEGRERERGNKSGSLSVLAIVHFVATNIAKEFYQALASRSVRAPPKATATERSPNEPYD